MSDPVKPLSHKFGTPSNELYWREAMEMLNDIYQTYGIDADNAKVALRRALYTHHFLNGTSSNGSFAFTLDVSGASIPYAHIEGILSGKVRKFFRTLQDEAYEFLNLPTEDAKELRKQIVNRYGGSVDEKLAYLYVDFFTSCIPLENKGIASSIKGKRLSGSTGSRKTSGSKRPVVEVIETNADVSGANGYENY